MTRNLEPAETIIKRFEGLHKKVIVKNRPTMVAVYRCPAGIPTIGYGHVCKPDQPNITAEEAEILLRQDMRWSTDSVLRHSRHPLTDNQLNELISFVFNVGSGAFKASTLRRKLNSGDIEGAASEFPRWKYAGGRVLAGLLARRLVEKDLFLK